MFENDMRTEKALIGGKEYDLILTTKAVMHINKRFGGLEKMGEKLSEDNPDILSEIVWLLTELANQGILTHNYLENKDKKLLTEDEVSVFMTPYELMKNKDAILKALIKGTSRNIKSETKNMEAGTEIIL